jgi:FlaG/FlaF family flagellin (archaellin)
MKANRKFKNADEDAVSAVIGVILMVAITVAIAATVYVYVSGMIGGGGEKTPTISCNPDNANNKLVIVSAGSDISWTDVNISVTNDTGSYYVANTGTVTAGEEINLDSYISSTGESASVRFRYTPTNSLIGQWTVS